MHLITFAIIDYIIYYLLLTIFTIYYIPLFKKFLDAIFYYLLVVFLTIYYVPRFFNCTKKQYFDSIHETCSEYFGEGSKSLSSNSTSKSTKKSATKIDDNRNDYQFTIANLSDSSNPPIHLGLSASTSQISYTSTLTSNSRSAYYEQINVGTETQTITTKKEENPISQFYTIAGFSEFSDQVIFVGDGQDIKCHSKEEKSSTIETNEIVCSPNSSQFKANVYTHLVDSELQLENCYKISKNTTGVDQKLELKLAKNSIENLDSSNNEFKLKIQDQNLSFSQNVTISSDDEFVVINASEFCRVTDENLEDNKSYDLMLVSAENENVIYSRSELMVVQDDFNNDYNQKQLSTTTESVTKVSSLKSFSRASSHTMSQNLSEQILPKSSSISFSSLIDDDEDDDEEVFIESSESQKSDSKSRSSDNNVKSIDDMMVYKYTYDDSTTASNSSLLSDNTITVIPEEEHEPEENKPFSQKWRFIVNNKLIPQIRQSNQKKKQKTLISEAKNNRKKVEYSINCIKYKDLTNLPREFINMLEPPAVFQFASKNYQVSKSNSKIYLDILRTGGFRFPLRLSWETRSRTANQELHFVQKFGVVDFLPGQRTKKIFIELNDFKKLQNFDDVRAEEPLKLDDNVFGAHSNSKISTDKRRQRQQLFSLKREKSFIDKKKLEFIVELQSIEGFMWKVPQISVGFGKNYEAKIEIINDDFNSRPRLDSTTVSNKIKLQKDDSLFSWKGAPNSNDIAGYELQYQEYDFNPTNALSSTESEASVDQPLGPIKKILISGQETSFSMDHKFFKTNQEYLMTLNVISFSDLEQFKPKRSRLDSYVTTSKYSSNSIRFYSRENQPGSVTNIRKVFLAEPASESSENTNQKSKSVTLKWDPPIYKNLKILATEIHVINLDDLEFQILDDKQVNFNTFILKSNVNEFDISNFDNGNYLACIRCYNQNGWGVGELYRFAHGKFEIEI